MSFNGSGTYSPPASSFPEVADTLIDANRYDAVITDLATGLSNTICKDGQTTVTANIPMNSNKITGLGNPSNLTDAAQFGVTATGSTTARTLAARFAEVANVLDYGAVNDGTGDQTAAFQAAITAATSASGSYGGKSIFIPSGNYRFTGTLTINKDFISLVGEGKQCTTLTFVNTTADCITIGTAGVASRDQHITDLTITGSSKTGGNAIKILNTFQVNIERVTFESFFAGIEIGTNNNSVTIRDCTLATSVASSTYGIWWHAPGDGTSRSDVLTLDNVVIEGNWILADGIIWEGMCSTMVASHLRVLHCTYGMRVLNTASSGSYYPQFLNAFDLEFEGFKTTALKINGGAEFKISDFDINNLSGAVSQGNADTHAIEILGDTAASFTRGIQLSNGRIGGCRTNGLNCGARDVQLANVKFYSCSGSASNAAATIRLTSTALQVLLANILGDEYGGLGFSSYAVQVDAGATQIRGTNIDGDRCVTGCILDNSASETVQFGALTQVDGTIEGVGYNFQNSNLYVQRTQNAASGINVRNLSAGASAAARLQLSTGTGNAFALLSLHDNAAAPYADLTFGSVVTKVNSGLPMGTTNPTGISATPYVVLITDSYVTVNLGGVCTLTLPSAANFIGRQLGIRTISANTVISNANNVIPLAGGAAGSAILAATAGKWAILVSDGGNWQIVAGN